jgi:methylglutaconyl-CoA hydratase
MNRIRTEMRGAVAMIVLSRPDRRNALDREAVDDLLEAVQRAGHDKAIAAVVIRSDGDDFCAGADLHALRAMLDEPLRVHEDDANALGALFLELRTIPVPTIAAVRGRVLAGGAALACACDIVLAHENSVFGFPEVAIGFVPAMAMAIVARCVGEKMATDLALTGRRVGAEEAKAMGLISRVLPAADFESGVDALGLQLASAPRGAMATTKALLHQLSDAAFSDAMRHGASVNAAARLTPEFREGVLRFSQGKGR